MVVAQVEVVNQQTKVDTVTGVAVAMARVKGTVMVTVRLNPRMRPANANALPQRVCFPRSLVMVMVMVMAALVVMVVHRPVMANVGNRAPAINRLAVVEATGMVAAVNTIANVVVEIGGDGQWFLHPHLHLRLHLFI